MRVCLFIPLTWKTMALHGEGEAYTRSSTSILAVIDSQGDPDGVTDGHRGGTQTNATSDSGRDTQIADF